MTPPLSPLQQISLREQVLTAIRDAIIQGKFKPGEKIPEQELAEQLGVSRTPIREAIRILEHQGLVVTRPKNGTYIANLDWDEVRDALHVRVAMEELAVRQALERHTPESWDELCGQLEQLLDGMREAVAHDDPAAATDLDIQWHTLLIDAAQNRFLSRSWRAMGLTYLVWSPERDLYPLTTEWWANASYKRHQELLAALRSRNLEQCAEALRAHILTKLADINQGLAQMELDTPQPTQIDI